LKTSDEDHSKGLSAWVNEQAQRVYMLFN